MANPWIEDGIGKIGRKIHQDVRQGNYEDASLYEWIIPCLDGLDCQPSQTWPAEHGFGDDGSSE